MNIDIVNKQVAEKLGIKEKKVQQINAFFWRNVADHIYGYNPQPVNIENICVLYPNKYKIKKEIYKYINKLRAIKSSRKFREGSPKFLSYVEQYSKMLRGFLKLRKENKFTN